MSAHSKKRAAEFSIKEPASKRASRTKPGHTDIVSLESSSESGEEKVISKPKDNKIKDNHTKDGPAIYYITVKLHSDYDVFPEYIRSNLQRMYENTIQTQMASLSANTTPNFRYRYSIITKRSTRHSEPTTEPNITLCKENIVSISIANTTLLEIFTKAWKEALVKPSFVYLKKKEGLANPDFTRLHAVRHGEIGWGFDTNSCLSLFVPTLEGDKLKEFVIYVQRTEIKVEKQED